jgi:hypothetical protein
MHQLLSLNMPYTMPQSRCLEYGLSEESYTASPDTDSGRGRRRGARRGVSKRNEGEIDMDADDEVPYSSSPSTSLFLLTHSALLPAFYSCPPETAAVHQLTM